MKREVLRKVVGDIKREIVAEVENSKSHIWFYEDGELQMIINISEDVINLEDSKFKERKYSVVFDYYLVNGIQDLTYNDMYSMIIEDNAYYKRHEYECEFEFVYHNKNGLNIDETSTNHLTAGYKEKINGVLFEFERYCDDLRYYEINELAKLDKLKVGYNGGWEYFVVNTSYINEYDEDCVEILVNGIPYTMLQVMFDRIISDEYLQRRNFFEEGSTLFDITKEQNRLLTKNCILNKQENFIKYLDFDGTVII